MLLEQLDPEGMFRNIDDLVQTETALLLRRGRHQPAQPGNLHRLSLGQGLLDLTKDLSHRKSLFSGVRLSHSLRSPTHPNCVVCAVGCEGQMGSS